MNVDGSGFHVVCGVAVCGQGLAQPRWSPDGSRLVFSNMGVIMFPSIGVVPSRIWVAGADRGRPRALTQPGCRPGQLMSPAWSPDGARIAFTPRVYHSDVITVARLATGVRTTVHACAGGRWVVP